MNLALLKKKSLEAYNRHGVSSVMVYEPITSIWTIKFRRYFHKGKCGWTQIRKVLSSKDIFDAFDLAYEKLGVEDRISRTSNMDDEKLVNVGLIKRKAVTLYNKHSVFTRLEYDPLSSTWTFKFTKYLAGKLIGWSRIKAGLNDADIHEAFELAYKKAGEEE